MHCKTVSECFQEINMYCDNAPTGFPVLINVENFDDFQAVLQRLEADVNKKCVFVSQFAKNNGLPMIDDAIGSVRENGNFALIGVSQAAMLRTETVLDTLIDEMLGLSISGHAIILLSHCKKFIERYFQRDPRLERRVILVDGVSSPLPQIRLTDNEAACVGFKPLSGIQGLLKYMERMDCNQLKAHAILTVRTDLKTSLFDHSLYSIIEGITSYDALCQKYTALKTVKEEYGTTEQWDWLLKESKDSETFSEVVSKNFGTTVNLIDCLNNVIKDSDKSRLWLLWISMHVFETRSNKYANLILSQSDSVDDYIRNVYFGLLDIKHDDELFDVYYIERSNILRSIPENSLIIADYCNKVGIHEKYAICYLTPFSERERHEFIKCLDMYDYDYDEIMSLLKNRFPDIYAYMKPFVFDGINTKLPESESSLHEVLTEYFKEYKQQKLTNRIFDDFVKIVETQAVERSFMKLQPRSSILSKIEKVGTGFFFFDSLGVEYLSFIQSKCEEYGLLYENFIGRCELPSITSKNKEFDNTYSGIKKISALDELKHHSLIYNYEKCKEPIYLFDELNIIDTELKHIQSQLAQGEYQRAVIISDHGASRLAVLYGKESSSNIELAENGIHSGRCCRIDEDPKLPQVCYEDGYAVLANYERFRGGRKADVEVHGGATLEEMLIPVAVLTIKPSDVMYKFTDPVIKFKMGQAAKITLFSSIPMKSPRINVNGVFHDGTFIGDKKHAEFTMPELQRTGSYSAQVFDGNISVGVSLDFSIERATKQKNLFGL